MNIRHLQHKHSAFPNFSGMFGQHDKSFQGNHQPLKPPIASRPPITCSVEALRRRYDLIICRCIPATASVDLLLPSVPNSLPPHLLMSALGDCISLCIMNGILPMCILTCDMLACGWVPAEDERTQKCLTAVECDQLAASGTDKFL